MALKNVFYCNLYYCPNDSFTQIVNHALGSNNLLKVGFGNKIYKEKIYFPIVLRNWWCSTKGFGRLRWFFIISKLHWSSSDRLSGYILSMRISRNIKKWAKSYSKDPLYQIPSIIQGLGKVPSQISVLPDFGWKIRLPFFFPLSH